METPKSIEWLYYRIFFGHYIYNPLMNPTRFVAFLSTKHAISAILLNYEVATHQSEPVNPQITSRCYSFEGSPIINIAVRQHNIFILNNY